MIILYSKCLLSNTYTYMYLRGFVCHVIKKVLEKVGLVSEDDGKSGGGCLHSPFFTQTTKLMLPTWFFNRPH